MKIKVHCEGISSLLLAPMTKKVIQQLRNPALRKPIPPDRSLDEEAKEKLIADENGRLSLPTKYLFACLRDAGRHVKFDTRKKISTRQDTLLPSFLMIEAGEFINLMPEGYLDDPADKRIWTVDEDAGKPDPKYPTMPIIRPKFPKWGFDVIVDLDEKQLSPDTLKKVFEMAGIRQGLGAFRPSKRGRHGRFKVTEWTILGQDGKEEHKTD